MRLSTFIPLAPEINKANISSQFSRDTQDISEVFAKAEFDEKERKKLADKKEAMPGGKFPIRNQKDLENAIHDVGRSNNPEAAKTWIKKRAKELGCEGCLPAKWSHKKEDKVEKADADTQKFYTGDQSDTGDADTESAYDGKQATKKNSKEKKDKVQKALDNILGVSSDAIESAFRSLNLVETDPINKAFEDVLKKGGLGSGRKMGSTKSGKDIYDFANNENHKDFTGADHLDAKQLHEKKAYKHYEIKNTAGMPVSKRTNSAIKYNHHVKQADIHGEKMHPLKNKED